MRAIAARLQRSPSTISREVAAHGGVQLYRAARADTQAWESAARPKPCRLADRPQLRDMVEAKLRLRWSPQQISGWLKRTYPNEPEMQVSHESIYRTLFVQSRGALNQELTRYLRTGRVLHDLKECDCPTVAAASRTRCTSLNDQPRQLTAPCPGTGKETSCSAAA